MSIYSRIFEEVNRIPKGKVASYGSVARAAGMFRGARIVGWALKRLPPDSSVPWQRVVNKQGEISIINPSVPAYRQKEMLEQEGVEFIGKEGVWRIANPSWFNFEE
jgi:methylated-DNA-protein-cysteine methyltransferase-like protein